MSYLTARAEQALIGALLTEQPLPAEFAQLRAEDFGHRLMRDLYPVITALRDDTPADRLPDAVAERLGDDRIDADRLRDLRDASPAPSHLASYARMVQTAAFRRDIAREAERIAATAGSQPDAGLDRLASALTRQSQVFQAFTEIDESHASQIPTAVPELTTGAADRAAREDQLLADLLANPDQALEVARLVPPDTFTTEQRREVFMTIVTLAAEGEPVDEVIVLWEFQQLRALSDLYDSDDDLTYRGDETSPEAAATYLARLAATTVVTGTAISIGYELVIDDERHRLAQGAAASAERRISDSGPAPLPRPGTPLQHNQELLPPAPGATGPQPTIDR